MKSTVFSALTSDYELVCLVGKIQNPENQLDTIPSIFYDTPSCWNSLPAVSFYEQETEDTSFADDACIEKKHTIRVDVWHSSSVKAVADRIDCIMRHLGFLCVSSCDIPDPNIRHRQALYSIYKAV